MGAFYSPFTVTPLRQDCSPSEVKLSPMQTKPLVTLRPVPALKSACCLGPGALEAVEGLRQAAEFCLPRDSDGMEAAVSDH